MSNVTDFIGGSGGSGGSGGGTFLPPNNINVEVITTSQTWTAPASSTEFLVIAMGGGGTGGIRMYTNGAGGGGGGSGHLDTKILDLSEGENITVIIGAGGNPISRTSQDDYGEYSNGNAGSVTSFGNYLSAAGGTGGPYYNSPIGLGYSNGGIGAIGDGIGHAGESFAPIDYGFFIDDPYKTGGNGVSGDSVGIGGGGASYLSDGGDATYGYNVSVTGEDAGLGAGSGGVGIKYSSYGLTCTTGAGGDGFVLIMWED